MMLMVGAFLGAKRTLLTIFVGIAAGQHAGPRVHGCAAQGFQLRIAVRDIFGNGGAAGGVLRDSSGELYQSILLGR